MVVVSTTWDDDYFNHVIVFNIYVVLSIVSI